MHAWLNRGALATAAFALAVAGLQAVPAHAATIIQVRPADLVAPNNTVGAATMQFLAEGIHVKVPTSSDSARLHFKANVPLSQVHTVESEWFGTGLPGQPGILYDIDINGDGKADGELVGELFYGGQDVWLNDNPTFPATTLAPFSPCNPTTNQPQNGNQDGCSPPNGAGAAEHGTLDDWNRSLTAAGKTATIVQGGFIASGIVMDGVLRSATYGPIQFLFTDAPKAPVKVKAQAARHSVNTGAKIKVTGKVKPAGPEATVSLQKKKNGKWKTLNHKAAAADGTYKLTTKAPGRPGEVKLRVRASETNSTAAATSKHIKVRVS